MVHDIIKRLKRLWHGTIEEAELNLYHLSPPSAEASAKRARRVRQLIRRMGGKYLNVAFKKAPEPVAKNVTSIRKAG